MASGLFEQGAMKRIRAGLASKLARQQLFPCRLAACEASEMAQHALKTRQDIEYAW